MSRTIPEGYRIMPAVDWQNPETAIAGCDKKYFYSEYDPTKRFYYSINRTEDTTDDTEDFVQSREEAWDKCFLYHTSFEQPLPTHIALYKSNINTETAGAFKRMVNIGSGSTDLLDTTATSFPPSKTESQSVATHEEKIKCYNRTGNYASITQNFYNATAINKFYLEIADFMIITDMLFDSESSLFNRMSMLNSTYGTELPTRKGMYYKKEGKWVEFNKDVPNNNICVLDEVNYEVVVNNNG